MKDMGRETLRDLPGLVSDRLEICEALDGNTESEVNEH